LKQAHNYLAELLQTGTERGDFLALQNAIPVSARYSAETGKSEQAVEIYALASRYSFIANSRWWEDVAGKHIAVVAETLPPEVVEAARARGQARDLEEAALAELAG